MLDLPRRVLGTDNLPHHWAQGPMDVLPILPVALVQDRICFWVFPYYVETPYIVGLAHEHEEAR